MTPGVRLSIIRVQSLKVWIWVIRAQLGFGLTRERHLHYKNNHSDTPWFCWLYWEAFHRIKRDKPLLLLTFQCAFHLQYSCSLSRFGSLEEYLNPLVAWVQLASTSIFPIAAPWSRTRQVVYLPSSLLNWKSGW